jgi:hypothetical protein
MSWGYCHIKPQDSRQESDIFPVYYGVKSVSGNFSEDDIDQIFYTREEARQRVNYLNGGDGLTRRERLAGQAMTGWLSPTFPAWSHEDLKVDDETFAALCYRMADAMIEEGKK